MMYYKISRSLFFSLLCFGGITSLHAQNNTNTRNAISGYVTSFEDGFSIPKVSVSVQWEDYTVSTDKRGKYTIEAVKGSVLIFSASGRELKKVLVKYPQHNVTLRLLNKNPKSLKAQRIPPQTTDKSSTSKDAKAPINEWHIVSSEEIASTYTSVDLTDLLTDLDPSFQSNINTLSDASDFTTSAHLRGLGQDHFLVLLHGARLPVPAVTDVFAGTVSGVLAPDMNGIPLAALERIDFLKGGDASTRYGSGAIAGVIDLRLKEETDRLSLSVFTGSYPEGRANSEQTEYTPGTLTTGDRSQYTPARAYQKTVDHGNYLSNGGDGQTSKINANYGIPFSDDDGKKTGFANFTLSHMHQGRTNRTGTYSGKVRYLDDPEQDELFIKASGGRDRFGIVLGRVAFQNTGLFVNLENKLYHDHDVVFYAFGGLNVNQGTTTGFYRLPSQDDRVNKDLFPLGYLPELHTSIINRITTTGLRSTLGMWDMDLSYTYGASTYDLEVKNSLNRSMGDRSLLEFEVGSFKTSQHTFRFNFAQEFPILDGFQLSIGSDYKIDYYTISKGEEASYTDYTIIDTINIKDHTIGKKKVESWLGGSQLYPGIRPDNEVAKQRNGASFYATGTLNLTKKWTASSAVRYTHFSDLAGIITGSLGVSYDLSKELSIQTSWNTGFKAPSLQQMHYSVSIDHGDSDREETPSNTSSLARLIGIDKLRPERSIGFDIGFTYQPIEIKRLRIVVKGFTTHLSDRIIQTGDFVKVEDPTSSSQKEINQILEQSNLNRLNFFTNAVDLRSAGLEVSLSYKLPLYDRSGLHFRMGYSYIDNYVVKVHYPSIIGESETRRGNFYTQRARVSTEEVQARNKGLLNISYHLGGFSALLKNSFYGALTANHESSGYKSSQRGLRLSSQSVQDLALSYTFSENVFKISVGANNLFNTKPNQLPSEKTREGRIPYLSVQQGFMGRFVFMKLDLNLGT